MGHKTAVVTGASRGIGRAIARRLVEEGYRVVGTYVNQQAAANALASEIEHCRFVQLDCRSEESVAEFVRCLEEERIDVLVNNAGVVLTEDFCQFDKSIWRDTIAINLTAVLDLSLALAERIPNGGSIVNISSLDGYLGAFDAMSYSASKAALINLTKSLALNLGPRGIRANTVAPGWIGTEMSEEFKGLAPQYTPLGREGRPEEIASVVNFLASQDASFITGETIIVDGGFGSVDPVQLEVAKNAGRWPPG